MDGTILPGVTRDSVLSLARFYISLLRLIARQWKEFEVNEAPFTIGDIIQAIKEDRLYEAFGAGTAAVVSPVKTIAYKYKLYIIEVNV